MNLIENKTTPDLAELELLNMENIISNGISALKNSVTESFKSFWFNSRATPEEMANRMGSLAEGLFTRHAQTVMFLMSQGVDFRPEEYTPPRLYHFENGKLILD